jgi:endonuclease/exonuclease/phosphatase family metal-dependent hydrolase
MKIRIATYNIHKGVSSIGSRPRIHALKQAIGLFEADVVFLQEVQGRHDLHATRHAARWPEQSQQDFLAGDSHQNAYGMNAVYDHGHHGNALLSKLPIISSRNQDVSDHAYESRGILHCVVRADGSEQDIHCYVVHLGLFAKGRRRQADALIEAVKTSAPEGAPVIIAGDFNDWGNHLGEIFSAGLGVTEVFEKQDHGGRLSNMLQRLRGAPQQPARTFPAAMPCLRLDRIYVRGFKVESAKVMHGALWARLSDHAPIVANLVLQ